MHSGLMRHSQIRDSSNPLVPSWRRTHYEIGLNIRSVDVGYTFAGTYGYTYFFMYILVRTGRAVHPSTQRDEILC